VWKLVDRDGRFLCKVGIYAPNFINFTLQSAENPKKIIGRQGLDAQSEEIYTPSTTSKSAVGLTQCHITWLAVVCV
jgi:hypothetical protein